MATKQARKDDPAVPHVKVVCTAARCSHAGVEQTVPAGQLLADFVLAPHSFNCTECGSSMDVTGPA